MLNKVIYKRKLKNIKKINRNFQNKKFGLHFINLLLVNVYNLGLNSIHDADIVHRDIKTANVFLFSNSNNEIKYKIGDLNVCK